MIKKHLLLLLSTFLLIAPKVILGFVIDSSSTPFIHPRIDKKFLLFARQQHTESNLMFRCRSANDNDDGDFSMFGNTGTLPDVSKNNDDLVMGSSLWKIHPATAATTMSTIILAGGSFALFSLPADAATVVSGSTGLGVASPIISALCAFGHYFSLLVIFGCLAAEKVIIKAGMTEKEENTVVKIDLLYGLMAALLIISGLFRATEYGSGSDFYLHEPLFWLKMTLSGYWGGMTLFPSIIFYKRSFRRKTESVPPLSDKLAARLEKAIIGEISAVLSIPLVATLMSRGVLYWEDFPWPIGLISAIMATVGSGILYSTQALDWTDEDDISVTEQEDYHSKFVTLLKKFGEA